jgi:hypothetical protein
MSLKELMQTILTMWRLLESLALLVVPQLLGVLAYFRLRKHHDFVAHLIGFLIPPVLFFYLSRVMLVSSAQEIQSRDGRVCGTYLGMMALMILFGTGIQTFFSLIAQVALHGRHRASTIPK